MDRPALSLSGRVYEWLLRIYPAAFRNEYGGEMLRVFENRRVECSGLFGLLLLWLQILPDTLLSACREHGDILRQDLRDAFRAFGRKPAFALTAIVVVALGVGANTAIFSAVDVVLVRPLPFPDSDRLVKLYEDRTHLGYPMDEPAPGNYADWKKQNTTFETVAGFRGAWLNLTGVGTPERLEGCAVTADLLPMLGVRPLLGRVFTGEEDGPDGPRTLILSHTLWKQRFGGDPAVLGRKVLLDGAPFEVIGVMPANFHFPRPEVEIWTAMRFTPNELVRRDNHYIQVLGRLRRGVVLSEARSEMQVIAKRLEREYPKDNFKTGVFIRPLREEISRNTRMLLLVLLSAAGAVLLIGCANLANLLLARASARRKELAVRSMLGAGADRLIRQVLTESLLLSCTGGALGILLAAWMMSVLGNLVPASLPLAGSLQLDLRVMAFGVALSLLTGIIFGVLPALQVVREASNRSGREGVGGRRGGFRNALVLAEISMSVVLLICAGLLIRTLHRLQQVDPGFRDQGVLTLRTYLPLPKYESLAPRLQFYRSVLSKVRSLPGVTNAAYISFLPLTLRGGIFPVGMKGEPADWNLPGRDAMFRIASPGYFETMGIPLLAGRDMREDDRLDGLKVAVVSASLVRQYWPNENPLGQTFHFADETRTVVGVVGDVIMRGLENSNKPQVYLPYGQVDTTFQFFAPKDLAVRATVDTAPLIPALRHIISEADPQQPISDIQTMTEILESETMGRREQLRLLSAFAALAFLLAGVGIHGVLSFAVGQRTPEIGVRMALGARPGKILTMILRQGVILSGTGVAIGLAAALLAARSMERLLVGVRPYDPVVFGAAAMLCGAVSLVAAILPARRAARVDPLVVIRAD